MNNFLRSFVIFFIIFIALAGVFSLFSTNTKTIETIGVGQLAEKIKNQEVKAVQINGDKLAITLTDNTELQSLKEPEESLSTILQNYGIEAEQLSSVDITVKGQSSSSVWLGTILPILIPTLLVVLFFWFIMRQAQGMNNRAMSFGQSNAKEKQDEAKKRQRTTFKDVAGSVEAKQELTEVVDFLSHPKKFTSVGAKIPKGVLMVGPPGTGKTLIAKAVAGEARVPFLNISGSEFVEMFVGVGASRVRDLFKRAKKVAPAIIFIDEIDAVGRQRGAGLGGSHDEREQTLNQILVEMDGFDTDTTVIVIAATNRPDVLDPALLRPGRFDRQVVIDLPEINEREAILKVHAKNKPLGPDVDLRVVAQRTPGFSGADLANLLNEAAILTARKNKATISQRYCLESIEKVMLGPERRSRVISEHEKKVTAYHEAGHALVAHELPHADPVHKISIIARGRAGGYTLKLPERDKRLHTKREFTDDLAVMLGGYVTEKIIFEDISTGPSNDLKQVTALARSLVTQFGMSDKLGTRTFGDKEEMVFLGREIHERRDYSEHIAQKIDEEVSNFISHAYKTAEKIVTTHKEKLEAIVKALMEKETLEREEFEKIVGMPSIPKAIEA
ncbi:MAG: ATP-dependent zinc metalloprotease FtsH [Patescibacteria group bacterium]|jgi:cell division protease FtsH